MSALNDKIIIDIETGVNVENLNTLVTALREAKTDAAQLKENMEGMDSPAKMLNGQVDMMTTSMDYVISKAEKLRDAMSSGDVSEEQKTRAVQEIRRGFDDSKTLQNMISGNGSFGVSMARQMLSGLPEEIQREFNRITPQVMSAIRSGMNVLNKDKNNKITARDLNGMVADAYWMDQMQAIFSQTKGTEAQKKTLLRALIPTAGTIQKTAEYQNLRYGNLVPVTKRPEKVEEILPAMYSGAYANHGFSRSMSGRTKEGRMVLSDRGMDALSQLISENPVAARAIERAGLASRDAGGTLTLGGGITKSKLYNLFGGELWNEFQTRTTGLKKKLPDFFGENAKSDAQREAIERMVVSRASSGTGGTTTIAMQNLSGMMGNQDYWQPKGAPVASRRIENEAKRLKEQYVIQKINPFTGERNNVTLAESQVTHLLGLQGHNYEDTDLIKTVDLGSYDASNPEQKAIVDKILREGLTENGKQYSVHAMHGTGSNLVLRMLENGARERVRKQYAPFAKQLGLAGTDIWNTFVPTDKKFDSPSDLGKHMEQLNKMWTDSYVLGSGLEGLNFAFVDFSKMGKDGKKINTSDGLGFALEGILPSAIQARFALSGKGSLAPIHAKSMLEWGEKAGLAKDGKLMLPGLGGEMTDVSKASALIDTSLVKNLPAFANLKGEAGNRALTGLMSMFPIAAAADYEYDGSSKGLGSQSMAFMSLSPAIMLHQAKALTQRMRELDTNEGKRKYVFNNPQSSVTARLAHDPVNGDIFLNEDKQAQTEVENYRRKLFQRVGSGEWINYSDDVGSIDNVRLVRNPLMAALMANGTLSPEGLEEFKSLSSAKKNGTISNAEFRSKISSSALQNVTNILESAHNRTFTPEEVMKYLSLEGGALDFENIDNARIGAIRSPTGFGQVVVRENYAKILKPVFDALGMDKKGLFFNDEDLAQMAGADFDGDEVKRVLGKKYKVSNKMSVGDYMKTLDLIRSGKYNMDAGPDLVDEIQKTAAAYEQLHIGSEEKKIATEALPELPGGNLITNMANWHRTIELSRDATNKMGYYSAVGERMAMLDLFDPVNRALAVMADKGNEGYDPSTTLNKKPVKILEDKALFQAIQLGEAYRKIPSNLEEMFNVEAEKDPDTGNVIRYTKKGTGEEVNPDDVFKASNGDLIDMRFFKGFNEEGGYKIDKTNLPSRFNDANVFGMLQLKKNNEEGFGDSSIAQALTEALTGENGLDYGDAKGATKQLMENRRRLLAEFVGAQRFGITDEEAHILSTQYAQAMKELDDDIGAREKAFGETGGVKLDDGSTMETWKYRNQQMSKYGLNQAALMLGLYRAKINGREVTLDTGMIRSKLAEQYGEDWATELLGDGTGVSLANTQEYAVPGAYNKYVLGKPQAEPKLSPSKPAAAPSTRTSKEQELAQVRTKLEQERVKALEQQEKNFPLINDEDFQTSEIKELEKRRKELEAQLGYNYEQNAAPFDYEAFSAAVEKGDMETARAVMRGQQNVAIIDSLRERVLSRNRDYNKEIFKNQERTPAEQWFGLNDYFFRNDNKAAEEIEKNLTEEEKNSENWRQFKEDLGLKNRAYYSGRRAYAANALQGIQNSLDTFVRGKPSEAESLAQQRDTLEQQVKNAQSVHDMLRQSILDHPDQIHEKEDAKALKDAEAAVEKAKQTRDQGIQKILEESAESFDELGDAFDEMLLGQDGKSPRQKIAKAVKDAKQKTSQALQDLDERFEKGVISADDWAAQREAWEQRQRAVDSGEFQRTLERSYEDKTLHRLEQKVARSSGKYESRKQDVEDVYKEAERVHNKNMAEQRNANLSPEEIAKSNQEAERAIELALEYENQENERSRSEISKSADSLLSTANAEQKSRRAQAQEKIRQLRENISKQMDELNEAKNNGVYADTPEEYAAQMQRLAEAYENAESRYGARLYDQAEIGERQDQISRIDVNRRLSGLRSSAQDEYLSEYYKLQNERDKYLLEHEQDEGFDADEFRRRYSDPNLEALARQQASYNRGTQDLQDAIRSRQTNAALSGRGLSYEEQIRQRTDELTMRARQEAERIRRNGGDVGAFWANHSYDSIVAAAQQQVDQAEMLRDQRMADRYSDIMLRGEQMRRNRSPFAQGFVGRTMGLRDSWESQARSYRASIQQELAGSEAEYRKYTDENGEQRKDLTEQEKTKADNLKNQIQGYRDALKQAESDEKKFAEGGGLIAASANVAGQAISRFAQRMGRRLFYKALQETKQFVKEFDASMTQIQTITMKTQEEMEPIRSGTISKALDLKTSVSNVATTEAELYRQGLSDQEVSERTDAIIKFSTVTGTKVESATKIITTALQNDLVASAEQAMDALTALGDSAATTAEEIAKGMQKSAAAAKVAGVSYDELTSMLTVITSKTQLGGAQAGTALQTIFSRMRKMSTSGLVIDANGETTGTNDVSAALKNVGISLFEENDATKFRNTTDVLRDLAKVWGDISDIQKSNIVTSMAGTRMTNMFSTLMEGLSEDGGAEFERLLGLASDSEGVTQSKYEIAIESLNASLNTLKSTWDGLIEEFSMDGLFKSSLDSVTGLVQGLANIASSAGPVAAAMTAIGAAVGALAIKFGLAAIAAQGVSKGLVGVVAMGATLAALGIGAAALNSGKREEQDTRSIQEKEADNARLRMQNYSAYSDKRVANAQSNLEKAKKLYEELKAEDLDIGDKAAKEGELRQYIADITNALPGLQGAAKGVGSEFEQWGNILQGVSGEIESIRQSTGEFLAEEGRKTTNEAYSELQQELAEQNLTAVTDKTFSGQYGFGLFDSASLRAKDYRTQMEKITAGVLPEDYRPLASENNIDPDSIRGLLREDYGLTEDQINAFLGITPDENNNYGNLTEEQKNVVRSMVGRDHRINMEDPKGRFIALMDALKEGKDVIGSDTVRSVLDAWLNTPGAGDLIKKYSLGASPEGIYKYESDAFTRNTVLGEVYDSIMANQAGIIDASKSAQNVAEQAKEHYVQKIMTSDDYYGSAIKQLVGGDSATASLIAQEFINENKDENGELNLEGLTSEAVFKWLFGERDENGHLAGGYLTRVKTGANARAVLSPSSEAYKYSIRDANGNALVGLNETDTGSVEKAIEEQIQAYQQLYSAEGTTPEQQADYIARIAALRRWRHDNLGTYDENKSRDIFTNATNTYKNSTPTEILESLLQQGGSKAKGYSDQYRQAYQAAQLALASGSFDTFTENARNIADYAPFLENDKELQAILGSLTSGDGQYNLQYLYDYLQQKSLGSQYKDIVSEALTASRNKAQGEAWISQSATNQTARENIAKALGIGLEDYLSDQGAWNTEYQNRLNKDVEDVRAKNLRYALRELNLSSIEGAGAQTTQEEIDRLNKELRGSGFQYQIDENGALSQVYNPAEYDSRFDFRDTARHYDAADRRSLIRRALEKGSWENVRTDRQFSEDDLSMLQSQSDLYEYLNLSDKNTDYAKELERRIKLDVTGVSELENAGKVLEGTSKAVEQLSQGGEFEIKARLTLTSNLYNQSQLKAMLSSGNTNLVDQAVQQITGVTGSRFYANRGNLINQANATVNAQIAKTPESLVQDYLAATDKDAFLSGLAGTGWSLSGLRAGYTIGEDGWVYDSEGRGRTKLSDYFRYNPQDYVYENPYSGKDLNYNEYELANMRKQIREGSLTEGQEGYEAALSSGGEAWKRYQTLLQRQKDGREVSAEALTQAEAAMLAEEATTLEESGNAQRLKDLKAQSKSSLAGAAAYAQESYNQANEGAFAADALVESLLGSASIDEFMEASRSGGAVADSLTKFIADNDGALKQLNDLGFTVANGQLSYTGNASSDQAKLGLLNILGSKSTRYQSSAGYSVAQRASLASTALSGYLAGGRGENGYSQYLNQLLGDSELYSRLINGQGLEDVQSRFANTLISNGLAGIEGLTARDRISFAQEMVSDFAAGKGGNYTEAMRSALSSGLSMEDLNILLSQTSTAEQKTAAQKRLEEQLRAEQENLERYDSVESAIAYARGQFSQNNKGALAAETAYGTRGGYSDWASFWSANKNISGMSDLVSSDAFRQFAETYLTEDLTGLRENVTYEDAMKAFSDLTAYSSGAYVSAEDQVRRARTALTSGARNSQVSGAEYIRSILGDKAYSDWLNGADLTGNEVYRTKLANYANGISGYTTAQLRSGRRDILGRGTADLLDYIQDESNAEYARDMMSGVFSDWDSYVDLLRKQGTSEFTEEDQKQLESYSQQLANIQKNAEIGFKVDGLRQMEEAGQLLAGTADSIERISKGGREAREELQNMQNKAFTSAQQYAQLTGGTAEERKSAAMSYLGYSTDEQYYANANAQADALAVANAERLEEAQALLEAYRLAPDEATRSSIERSMARYGYKPTVKHTLGVGPTEESEYGLTATETPEQERVNPLKKEGKVYSDRELADYAEQILDGTVNWEDLLKKTREGTEEQRKAATEELNKFQQAAGSMGKETSRYATMLAAEEGTYTQEELDTAKMLSDYEVKQTRRSLARDSLRMALENAGLSESQASSTANLFDTFAEGSGEERRAARNQMRSEGFEYLQNRAKFQRGTASQRAEAAMSILGMGRDEFYANESANLAEAEKQFAQQEKNRTKELDVMWQEAFNKETGSAAKREAYYEQLNAYGMRHTSKGHEAIEGAGIANVNPYAGRDRAFRSAELARAASEIAAGTRERGENEDARLYDEAVAAAGYWTQELARLDAKAGADKNGAEYKRVQENAQKETAQLAKDAEKRQKLEDYRLSQQNEEIVNTASMVQDVFTKGTASDRLSTLGSWNQSIEDLRKAQFALDNGAGTNSYQGYIASLLGMKEDEVRDLVATDEGKDKIQEAIKDKTSKLLTGVLDGLNLALGTDFDSVDLSSLTEQINANKEKLGDDLYNWLSQVAQALDIDLGSFSGADENTDFMSAAENIKANLGDNRITERGYNWMDQNADLLYQTYRAPTDTEATTRFQTAAAEAGINWGSFMEQNPLMSSVLSSVADGTISSQGLNTIIAAGQSGIKDLSYYNTLGQATLGNNFLTNEGKFRVPANLDEVNALQQRIQQLEKDTTGKGELFNEWKNGVEGISDAINTISQSGDIDAVIDSIKSFNASVDEKRSKEISKYGNEADRALKKLASSYGTMSKLAYNAQKINDMQKKMTEGKGYKDFISEEKAVIQEMTQLSDKQLKAAGNDMIASLLEGMKESTGTDWAQQVARPMVDSLNDYFNNITDENEAIQIKKAIEFSVDASSGQVDISALADAVAAFNEDLANALRAYDGVGGTLTAEMIEGDNMIGYILHYLGSKAGASPRGGGGGGGGGGGEESELDKMLKRQQHEVKQQQHLIKMSEISQEHYDNVNNYDAWLDEVEKDVDLQKDLAAIYQKHIEELEASMAGLEEYTDDWYKVSEALMTAQESLAQINNEIYKLKAKRVDIIVERQENELKPQTHKEELWDAKAEKWQIRNRFESYQAARQHRIDEYQNHINENNRHIVEMENELQNQIEGSDAWLKARDEIWAKRAEAAQLENERMSAIYELNNERIQQYQTDVQNRQAPREHEVNMLDVYSNLHQTNRQYDEYRNELTQKSAITKDQIAIYEQYIDVMKQELDTLEEGSEAWVSARDALFQYEEAIAQAAATQDEINRSIEQSRIDELNKKYEDINDTLSHQLNILKTQQERYDKNDNFTMYLAVTSEMIAVTEEKLAALTEQLAGYESLIEKTTVNTDQFDTLQESYRQTAEEIESTKNELEEFNRIMNQSEFEHIQEEFNRQDALDQHNIKMAQYQETMYQNRGELTNYGTMLKVENRLREERIRNLENYLVKLRKQLDAEKEGTDQYYKVADAIYKAEEQIESETVAIDKNTETLKKNIEAILKTKKAVIDLIDTEIKNRVKEQREQLTAEVQIQNQILNVIRKRYQQEAQIIQQDLNKKKQALQEEKALINERLNARLQAEQEEERHAELSELKRQLSLISSDPTRGKDAKELQKRIDDIEKQNADEIARQEAQAEIQRRDDEAKALDQYMAYNKQRLDEMLKDANSTRLYEELNEVLNPDAAAREQELMAQLNQHDQGSDEYNAIMAELTSLKDERFNNYMDWIRENDENYKFGTEAMRLQMEETNRDNWDKMIGFIDTYWDQVDNIIGGGLESIVEYMKESSSYRWSSDTGRKLSEYNWDRVYEAYEDAYKDNAGWDHGHELEDSGDDIFEINRGLSSLNGLAQEWYNLYQSQIRYDWIRNTAVDPDAHTIDFRDYKGIGQKEFDIAGTPYTATTYYHEEGGGGGGKPSPKYTVRFTDAYGNEYSLNDEKGIEQVFKTVEEAQKAMDEFVKRQTIAETYKGSVFDSEYANANKVSGTNFTKNTGKSESWINKVSESIFGSFLEKAQNLIAFNPYNQRHFAEGGLVDYTGPAWVDGTKTRPEAFLSATDTEMIRNLVDSLSYVHVDTSAPYLNPDWFSGGDTSIGDININISANSINSDQDLDYLARQVGIRFTKEMSKQGLNLAGYDF